MGSRPVDLHHRVTSPTDEPWLSLWKRLVSGLVAKLNPPILATQTDYSETVEKQFCHLSRTSRDHSEWLGYQLEISRLAVDENHLFPG